MSGVAGVHSRTAASAHHLCQYEALQGRYCVAADVLILVDYPGFNLDIAKFVHANTRIPVFYYISPKIWAWKEYRIKNIKRDVDELFSILPPVRGGVLKGKHGYPIHYVGNPTVDEVTALASSSETFDDFVRANGLSAKPVITLLAGGAASRKSRTICPTCFVRPIS